MGSCNPAVRKALQTSCGVFVAATPAAADEDHGPKDGVVGGPVDVDSRGSSLIKTTGKNSHNEHITHIIII